MKGIVQTIHMIGIGGAGMSGIAEVLLNLGYTVTGSDLAMGAAAQRLAGLGAQVHKGHEAGHVGHADVVVKSTAVPESNPEVVEARRQGIPVIPRAEMLAELMRLRSGIAVAGTHGKTTTTSLLAEIFGAAGQDPTVIIGGRLNAYGANARLGQGKYLIAEADESDGSFLILQPIMAIVTNIDADHLDHYPNLDAIDAAFVQFMNKVPFYGVNVVCGDDEGVRRVLPRIKRRCLTYGLEPDNRLRGEIVSCTGTCRFKVYRDGQFWAEVVLGKPGRHNVLNALAAIGIALEAGLDKTAILAGLENFGGVGRRFEVRGQTRDDKDGILVVDDYGHHPAEIRATLRTARECFPDRRLVVAFQPHRFTRTQALFGDFCTVFDNADLLLLTEIYPASEAPIPGVSGMSLAQGIKQVGKTDVRFYPTFAEMQAELPGILQPGDVFLTLGAGSIWQVGAEFLKSRQSGAEQGA